VRHQEIFCLSDVDGVAKLPAAKRPTTLRPVSTQTEVTLSARCNCAHQNAVSNFIPGYAFSKLVDNAHGLMADDQARFDGISAYFLVTSEGGNEVYVFSGKTAQHLQTLRPLTGAKFFYSDVNRVWGERWCASKVLFSDWK
jgi:hypothetical protein